MAARLVFGMNQSLDGYVDHDSFAPDSILFRHFIEQARTQTGSLYGRRLYEIMAYWDVDHADWEEDGAEFAAAWRANPKWVVSRGTPALGPNATLLRGDLATAVRALKEEHDGVIEVGGPVLAKSLADLGLIDEYVIYLHPVVMGQGRRFFHDMRPRLRLTGSETIGEGVMRQAYVPA